MTDEITAWSEEFGRRVARIRSMRGLTQQEVAERLGLSKSETISRYERGVREPRLSTVLRLAVALGVTPSELVDGLGATTGRQTNPDDLSARAQQHQIERVAEALARLSEPTKTALIEGMDLIAESLSSQVQKTASGPDAAAASSRPSAILSSRRTTDTDVQ